MKYNIESNIFITDMQEHLAAEFADQARSV